MLVLGNSTRCKPNFQALKSSLRKKYDKWRHEQYKSPSKYEQADPIIVRTQIRGGINFTPFLCGSLIYDTFFNEWPIIYNQPRSKYIIPGTEKKQMTVPLLKVPRCHDENGEFIYFKFNYSSIECRGKKRRLRR